MAERKVDWGRQASYCRLQAKINIATCINYCGLAIESSEGHYRLMSCTKSYGKSNIELLIHIISFKKIRKIQLKLIPVFHSTIPFHCSIPPIPDSH